MELGVIGYIDEVSHIVIHCSDSVQGRGDNARTIHQWHLENGWAGIGYHYVIDETGEVEAGRPEYWPGAHVKGYNEMSLGICLIGKKHFTDEQLAKLKVLLIELKYRHRNAKIVGHRDLDHKKTCPNFDVKKWCREQQIKIS